MSRPSKPYEERSPQHPAPEELRVLAGLELKKRQFLRELAEVLQQYQQLSREIELKGIPIPD